MARLGAWTGLLVAALYVLILGGAWNGIYESHLRVLTLVIAGVILGCWLIVSLPRPQWRPRTVLWPAIAAVLASMALSTLLSHYQRVSLEYLGLTIVLIALYLLLVRLFANPFFRARLVALSAMVFVGLTVVYLGENVLLWIGWWLTVGRLTVPPLRPGFAAVTYGNPSAALTMITLFAMPALATFTGASRRRGLVVSIVGMVVLLVALVSGSRAGWLAIGLIGVLAVFAWLASSTRRGRLIEATQRLFSSRYGRIVALAVVALMSAGALILGPPILLRLGAGGEASRLAFSVVALRIFASAPFFGTGLGTWTIQHIAYTQPGESTEYIPYAHNLETQTLAELGLVGVAAGAVVVANIIWLLRDGRRDPDSTRRRWAVVAILGLAYFVLQQQLDFYENLPAALIAAAWPIAYLDASAQHPAPLPRGFRSVISLRWARYAMSAAAHVALVGSAAWLLTLELPGGQSETAVDLANDGQWAAADRLARSAAAADPEVASYRFTAGLTAAHAGDHAAAAGYFASVSATDDYPEAWLDLAAERVALGDPWGGESALASALRLGIQQPSIAFGAADLALRLGDSATALRGFMAAVAARPSVAADTWWTADPARLQMRADVLEALQAQATPDILWELRLVLGGSAPGGESATEDAALTSDPQLATLVTRAWQGNLGARHELDSRCEAEPLDSDSLFWCARVAGHLGDPAAQDHWIEVAGLMPSSNDEAGREVRVATTELDGRFLVGAPGYFWGLYTYRDATPWDVLVPSLAHLTYG